MRERTEGRDGRYVSQLSDVDRPIAGQFGEAGTLEKWERRELAVSRVNLEAQKMFRRLNLRFVFLRDAGGNKEREIRSGREHRG